MSEDPAEYVIVKTITSASLLELIRLYKDAGWWEDEYDKKPEFLHHIVKDSGVFVGAFLEKKLIGMGRALSDMASDAYIQDIVVLKQYRGRGIGKKIIRLIVKILNEKGVDWIGLVAQPGTTSFYEKLGFEPLKGHTPLKYREKL